MLDYKVGDENSLDELTEWSGKTVPELVTLEKDSLMKSSTLEKRLWRFDWSTSFFHRDWSVIWFARCRCYL